MSRVRCVLLLLVAMCFLASGVSCTPPAHAATTAATFSAPPREADTYETIPTPGVNTGDPVVQIAETAILGAAKMRKLSLVVDARLTELAAWIATQRLHRLMPSGEAIDYAASYLGLTGPTPQVVGVAFDDDSSLASELAAKLARMPANIEFKRYGRAVLSYGPHNMAVVVVTTADVELSQPVPKKVRVGDPVHVKGSVVAPFSSVHASVTAPDGTVEDTPQMPATFDILLSAKVAGVHQVELLADGPNGPGVVANFPLFVDVDEPRAFTEAATPGDGGSIAETAEMLFKKLNESRAQAKLPPLERLAIFEPIAKANSEDMVEHHFFAHVSPTTGDVGDRVKRAGISLSLVGENIALGASANAMHVGLMGSPGHRGAILSKEFTHVGIGVAYDGDGSYIATEIFTTIAKPLDLARAPTDALAVINAARTKAKVGPLTLDPALSEVARAGAKAFLESTAKTTEEAVAETKTAITVVARKTLAPGSGWSWVPLTVGSLDDLSHADVNESGSKSIGIGIAQGPKGPLPSVLVVVLVLDR